jgi:hypothetical protein|uniref:hypothetical protein n=1 Tax=Cephaloticoccus sp. TaxID=1985742 RepID=UPI00404B8E2A
MAIWEYKVISSGKGGFASPAMLEKFLNDLGKEEWEVIDFRTPPDNPLAFNGLARRSTQRDWTLEDAAASAAKAEADKIRAEFEAKFKGMAANPATEPETALAEQVAPDDGYRSPVDTSRDQDPDADDDEPKDEWDQLVEEDELPTFFEAIRPHMRRNQRGPGMSVGVDFLAKKWGFDESDVLGALKECGFVMPEDEDSKTAYLEYDGDLFWVNINRRGELWINTKEKPMPVYRIVPGQPIEVAEESKPTAKQPAEKPVEKSKPKEAAKPQFTGKALPEGSDLLDAIRPKMRRNRHDAGGAGSVSFLTRAFKCSEQELMAAFVTLGLALPDKDQEAAPIEIGDELWWLNQDQRGGVWINGRKKSDPAPEKPKGKSDAGSNDSGKSESNGADGILTRLRPMLKPARGGAQAADLETLAKETNQSTEDLLATLVATGFKVPEKAREKPVTLDQAGEAFWLSKNAKGELSLQAKPVQAEAKKTPKRPRSKKPSSTKE